MDDMLDPQELYCHLDDYRFVDPRKDSWESFKSPIRTFLDCWANSSTVEFNVSELNELRVLLDGELLYKMRYNPDEEYAFHFDYTNPDGDEDWNAFNFLVE